MKKYIITAIMILGIVSLYLILNIETIVFESKNIVNVSENYGYSEDVYYISSDGNVYSENYKLLFKEDNLTNVEKIITTRKNEIIVLKK